MMMEERINKRIFDLINIKEWEVKLSILITAIFIAVLSLIEFYDCFFVYENAIENLLGNLLNALIGLLGFSLSGIAIIVSLFSTKEAKLIERFNGNGKIVEILEGYSFLAINIAFQCLALIVIYFLICSECALPDFRLFYFIIFVEVYHVIFIVMYTVALVKNCIELYKIKNIYTQIENTEKTIHDTVNEIKIDYIFSTLINNYGCTQDEVIDNLIEFVRDAELENKESIINYMKKQYNK